MGASQSNSQTHPPSRALHVLRVAPASPASQTNIEPYFDFVVGFEGDSLASQHAIDVSQLETIVENHEGRKLNLLVWNSKIQDTRVVPIVPSRAWSLSHLEHFTTQNQEPEPRPSLLGLSMKMCEPEFALDNVWHVLDVLEGSPAESAGLVPYGDWIVGWSGSVLSAEGDFYELVEAHVDKPLRVYVYSYDFDTVREVVLVPNRQWGGEGLLGCVFGFGLLHRIPLGRQPEATPAEVDQPFPEYEEQELYAATGPPGGHPELMQEDAHHHYRAPSSRVEQIQSITPRGSHDTERTLHRHNHSNGFDHNLHYLDENPSETTPRRASTWTINSMSTPTRSQSFGTLMNGPGTARLLSPRAGTPVAGLRPPLLSGFRDMNSDENGNEENDDNDGEESILSTEAGSDTNSLASSLTSVD